MAVLGSACKSIKDPSNGAQLSGTWTLSYITGPRIAFEGLYPNNRPSMEFDLTTNTLSGSTSCNRFNSTIALEGNKITIGSPATTKMFCEGQGEPTFVNMLPQINSYHVKEDVLTFYRNEVEMMRFTKE